MSYRIVSYHIISCHVMSCRVVSLVSYRIVSYRIVSYHIISCHVMSCRVVSCRVQSYRIVSYHIISYHIISDRTGQESSFIIQLPGLRLPVALEHTFSQTQRRRSPLDTGLFLLRTPSRDRWRISGTACCRMGVETLRVPCSRCGQHVFRFIVVEFESA